jgi:hypothetical protein
MAGIAVLLQRRSVFYAEHAEALFESLTIVLAVAFAQRFG